MTTATAVKREKPLWSAKDNMITILNSDKLLPEQLKYLKAFIGKEATADRKEKMIAAIKANETAAKALATTPKKEEPKQQPKAEEPKSAEEEVAASKTKSKDVAKPKPKTKPKADEREFKAGDILPVGLKILSADVKPKVGHYIFLPNYRGISENENESADLYMQLVYIGKTTVWFVELHGKDNAIPATPKVVAEHYLDIDPDDKQEDWLPFFLCEEAEIPKDKSDAKAQAKEAPKAEPTAKEEPKAEEKPKVKPKAKAKAKAKATA